jgi:branched-chain amino acid transport system permease protein
VDIRKSTAAKNAGFISILIVLVILPFITKGYIISLLATIFVAGVLASSWNLMAGFCGYVSFGHQVFFGVGAYTTAILVTSLKLGSESLWYSVLLGGLVAGAVAFALGYPALKLRGPYFSILTMGISEIFYVIMVNTPWFGGAEGLNLPPVYTLPKFYLITLITFVAIYFLFRWLKRSKFGFALSAIRQDEDAAEASGVSTHFYKMLAFAISGFFPGIIGGAYVWYITYIDAVAAFELHIVVQMIAITMFGGLGTVVGPLIGSVFFTLLSEYLWARMPELYLVVLGIIVVIVIEFMPRGAVVHALEALKIKIV